MEQFLIQFFGFTGILSSLLVFQSNNRNSMLSIQVAAAVSWMVHFAMLGAWTGTAMGMISIIRSYAFTHSNISYARKTHWLYILIGLFIMAGLYTWVSWYSILPIFAMVTGTIAFWMTDTHKIRLLALLAPPSWIIHNFIVGSYAGVLVELLILSSIVLAIFRFDNKSRWQFAPHITAIHMPHFGLHNIQRAQRARLKP